MNSIGASLAASAARGLLNSATSTGGGGGGDPAGAAAIGINRWEYARLLSTGEGVDVVFTHRQAWARVVPEGFFDTLRRLGDEGWELVSVLPLAANVSGGGPAGPGGAPAAGMQLRVEPDRWLIFKRPLAEPPPTAAQQGEDVLRGLVNRHVLKGR